MIRPILVPTLLALNVTCFAGEPFDSAAARAKADAEKPNNKVWVSAMSEAIGTSIGKAFRVCVTSAPPHAEIDLSLVLDVMPDGHVAKVWTASESAFTSCLARQVETATYPHPAAESYFSLLQNHPIAASGS